MSYDVISPIPVYEIDEFLKLFHKHKPNSARILRVYSTEPINTFWLKVLFGCRVEKSFNETANVHLYTITLVTPVTTLLLKYLFAQKTDKLVIQFMRDGMFTSTCIQLAYDHGQIKFDISVVAQDNNTMRENLSRLSLYNAMKIRLKGDDRTYASYEMFDTEEIDAMKPGRRYGVYQAIYLDKKHIPDVKTFVHFFSKLRKGGDNGWFWIYE